MSDERSFECKEHAFKLNVTGAQIEVDTENPYSWSADPEDCESCDRAVDDAFDFAEGAPTP